MILQTLVTKLLLKMWQTFDVWLYYLLTKAFRVTKKFEYKNVEQLS